MKTFHLILFFTLVAILFVVPLVSTSGEYDERVINGKNATASDAPYQVSVQIKNGSRHFCGGSILSNEWIVTAAHCCDGFRPEEVQLVVGCLMLSKCKENRYDVAKIVMHSWYEQLLLSNDICMMKAKSEISFGEFIQPISINSKYIDDNEPLSLTGWGYTEFSDRKKTLPDTLQIIPLKSLSTANCNWKMLQPPFRLIPLADERKICTLTMKGEGACKGDSGGPLVSSDKQLVGIVSYGIPCAQGKPDVYTRAMKYQDWMLKTMSEQ